MFDGKSFTEKMFYLTKATHKFQFRIRDILISGTNGASDPKTEKKY